MPVQKNVTEPLFSYGTGLVPTSIEYSVPFDCSSFDYLIMEVDFSIGSLTSLTIGLEFSSDGVNWRPVYDCNQGIQAATFTTAVNRFQPMGGEFNNARMTPCIMMAPLGRLSVLGVGTATGSSLELGGSFFGLGGPRE